MKKWILYSSIIILSCRAFAHEPLFGLGPHVLFKGGFAPHISMLWSSGLAETEYSLGYGITKNWTMIAEAPFNMEGNLFRNEGFHIKSKNRLWLNATPGKSIQGSIVSKLELPARSDEPTAISLAFTTGQEALKFYWFASAGYAARFTDNELKPGNNLLYNFTIGYRPFKVDYYKPDLVLFIETTGNAFQKSKMDGELVETSGGTNFAIAPTMFLTYKNLAVRGGVQFGLSNSTYAPKIDKTFKLTVELHI